MIDKNSPYAFELNEHDVLCGRGSGPNDRVGNINFRNLVLSRKAEYLAAPSRDAKGRIATNIVDTIRARGGRFLKKLSAANVKEAGFKRGTAVYEMADETTVLEKAKQTLRQNRAEFVQLINLGGDVAGGTTSATVAEVAAASVPSLSINDNGGNISMPTMTTQQQQLPTTLSQPSQNGNSNSSVQGSLNPIPLCDASVGLDSMQRPNLSARTAELLNRTLFSSSNISSITNPSSTNPSVTNSSMMNMSNPELQMGTSTASSGSGNHSIMSMNTAELCAAMGGSFNNISSQNSNMSGTSAQVFGSLLQEYNSEEEKNLMQQYEQLKAQQELMLQQQQVLPQSFQPNMQYIPEDQQQSQFQQQQQQLQQPQQQEQNASNVFASLLRQYNTLEVQTPTTEQQQYEQQQAPPPHAVGMQQQQQQHHSHDVPNIFIEKTTSNNDALSGSLLRRLSAEDQQKLLQQFQHLETQQVEPYREPILQQVYNESVTAAPQNKSQQNTMQMYNDFTAILNNSEHSSSQMGSYVDSSSTLKMGSSYMDSSATLKMGSSSVDSSATLKMGSSYMDSSAPLNDLQPSKKQPGDGLAQDNPPVLVNTFDNSDRRSRRRRRSTFSNDNGNSLKSMESLRLSKLEPADYNEESLRLSFLTANRLANTLDDMSTTSLGASGTWGTFNNVKQSATNRASMKLGLDCSMLSLMSMSLSEMHQDLLRTNSNVLLEPSPSNQNTRDNSDENVPTNNAEWVKSPPTPEVTVENKDNEDDMRFGESVMSLGASLDEEHWNK